MTTLETQNAPCDTLPHPMKRVNRWVLWRKQVRGGTTTKVPYYRAPSKGLQPASSTNPQTWMSYEEAVEAAKRPIVDGIGFVLGGGWFGVDLDHVLDMDTGDFVSEKAKDIYSHFEGSTYIELSPGGDGIHIIGKGSKPERSKSQVKLDGERCSLECYGSGRYFTVTGETCSTPADPDSDLQAQEQLSKLVEDYLAVPTPGNAQSRQRASQGPSRPSGGFGVEINEDYIMALLEEGVVPQGQRNNKMFRHAKYLWGTCEDDEKTLQACHELNRRLYNPPLDDRELERTVKNGIANAQVCGIKMKPQYVREKAIKVKTTDEIPYLVDEGQSKGNLKDFFKTATQGQRQLDVTPFLKSKGFIGQYLRHYKASSPEFLPELGLASALNCLSVMIGGKITAGGTHPSIYTCGLAPSGAGKAFPMSLTENLLIEGGFQRNLGPNHLSSGEGFASAMAGVNAPVLYQIDEAAETIAEAKGTSSPLAARLTKFLKDAYSRAGSRWAPISRADQKLNYEIAFTYPVLYMVTTLDRFWSSFSPDSVADGLLGRLLIFEQPEYTKRNKRVIRNTKPSEELIEAARAWYNFPGGPDLAEPKIIDWGYDNDARELLCDFFEEVDDKAYSGEATMEDAIWKRTFDKVAKVATLMAASRVGPSEDGKISLEDAQNTLDIVKALTYRTIYRVDTDLVHSEDQRLKIRILRTIKRKGGWIASGQRTQLFKDSGRVLKPAFQDLTEAGLLKYFFVADLNEARYYLTEGGKDAIQQ